VPEDAVPALAEVGHEVEAQILVGQRVVAAVAAAQPPFVLAVVLDEFA
jgi:hypothetical protein